jgi:hypothetical protein
MTTDAALTAHKKRKVEYGAAASGVRDGKEAIM